ncbi:cytochrome-c peroxidase [Afifella sp. IM 167]|uniref:cytochrome-c peroxidase n=1 Tax=Afifella sp. IM 167 TaxID=2033586 RepID=UPI0027148351|nr:cytochrome-c peroxidase [Afifella sp. IM 167]MBZ8132544.1 cytochrome C peroxidase [Afifella sp. IM 167]
MNRLLVSLLMAAGLGTAAQAADDQLMTQANEIFDPIPTLVQAPEHNAITREKVELGKMLYFDPRLSSSHLLSCNTCHNLGLGGTDLQPTSVGHGWQRGPRNAPTVLNAVFNIAQFWDGRAEDLKAQAVGPMQAAVEMNSTPERVLEVLNSMEDYKDLFDVAFPGDDDPVKLDNVAKAIEAFEVTLVTPASPFDQFLDGNTNAMTDQQKEGLALFMDKGCATCHSGVNVGGQAYFPFGVVEQPGADILPRADKGRFAVTQTASDEYVFRAGSLRNVALTAPYFHSGQVWSLRQAVEVMATAQLGTELSEEEVDAIVAFLHALTGEQPQVEYPILPASTDTTPPPVLTLPGQDG